MRAVVEEGIPRHLRLVSGEGALLTCLLVQQGCREEQESRSMRGRLPRSRHVAALAARGPPTHCVCPLSFLRVACIRHAVAYVVFIHQSPRQSKVGRLLLVTTVRDSARQPSPLAALQLPHCLLHHIQHLHPFSIAAHAWGMEGSSAESTDFCSLMMLCGAGSQRAAAHNIRVTSDVPPFVFNPLSRVQSFHVNWLGTPWWEGQPNGRELMRRAVSTSRRELAFPLL